MDDVIIKRSKIGQFDKGVFANRDFEKGEVVVRYNLKPLTEAEYQNLPESEKEFTHKHWGVTYLYPSPARYVNHSSDPNTTQNLKDNYDVAMRDIKKGEEITYDYCYDIGNYEEHPCRCGSKNCVGYIVAEKCKKKLKKLLKEKR